MLAQLLFNQLNINDDTTYRSLGRQMSELASEKILVLDLIENKKAVYVPQNENEATYAKKLTSLKLK